MHSVDPALPHCVLLNSTNDSDRVLTITGKDLLAFSQRRLQFLNVDTNQETILFDQEVSWLDPRRISIDMEQVDLRFRTGGQLRLQARIVSAGSPRLASAWSDEFIFALNVTSCGIDRRFPPTSPIRGIAGDPWADVVIGQPDFSQIAPKSVVPFKVYNPTGVVVDRSVDPGRAYIWDSGNSRVLGIDLAQCYRSQGPCSADVVIGQPSGYDHAACNGDDGVQNFPQRALPTAETLCGNPDHSLSPWEAYSFVTMAVDSDGGLFLPDFFNHRILKYENPFETDSVADQVWGQADFSGMVCNRDALDHPTAESLCFQSDSIRLALNHYGAGVEIDAEGNLWVADVGNNRVLRFPGDAATGEISKTADLVLGQSDFRTAGPGRSLRKFHAPSAVRFDSRGRLYVADAANSRVLVFEPPFTSGAAAAMTFGSQLHHPTSLEIDPLGRGIWIVDARNYMVELWDETGTSVLRVLGKSSYEPDGRCGSPLTGVQGGPHMCPIGGSIGLDEHGNVLVPVYHNAADVFRFPTSTTQAGDGFGSDPDKRFFFPPFEDNLRDGTGIHSARGIATWKDQLIVSDIRRLMFWNGLDNLTSGQPADGVIGDESAVGEWPYCCGRIKVDAAGRLWVLAFEGVHFLDVYQLPLTEHSVPLHTIWKHDAVFPVLGTEEKIALGHGIQGIIPIGGGEFLWLSDTDNHRVLRIRDPLTNPVVDVVLGQLNAGDTECNRGRHTGASLSELCYPGALSIDRMGNLYVSDHALEVNGNLRLLVFSADSTPLTNSETIFAPRAAKALRRSAVGLTKEWADPWESRSVIGQYDGRIRGPLLAATWEPAFDSANRMVVGYNAYVGPRFVGVYEDPLGQDTLPTSFLYDFGSMPYTATFDDNDHLYVGDINRGRVLVYRNPFNNPAQTSAESQQQDEPPNPSYPVVIASVSPGPPYCVVRNSSWDYETILELELEGLQASNDLTLEFRKVTSAHREYLDIGQVSLNNEFSRMRVNQPWFWYSLWKHIDKVTLTIRILKGGPHGPPISNWSPAFLLANDVTACGIALPTPTPTPTDTFTPSPSPTSSNTPTTISSLTSTVSPIPSPLPTPTMTSEPATQIEGVLSPVVYPTPTETVMPGSNITALWYVPAAAVSILLTVVLFIVWKKRR